LFQNFRARRQIEVGGKKAIGIFGGMGDSGRISAEESKLGSNEVITGTKLSTEEFRGVLPLNHYVVRSSSSFADQSHPDFAERISYAIATLR